MRNVSSPHIRLVGLVLALVIWTAPAVTAQSSATPPVATPPNVTTAAPTPMFGIYPVGDYDNRWFEITLDAGDSVELTAGVANTGDAPASLITYATNASSAPNGGFSAGTADDAPVGPTTWVTYETADLTLQPDEAVKRPFTITVPDGTEPGFYVVALVAQTADSFAIPGTDILRQVIRSAVSVEITVPGEAVSSFRLGAPDVTSVSGQWLLDIPITNTGTARLKPEGTLVVTDADGKAVSTADVQMGSVYGGNTTSVRVTLPEQLPPGGYLVSLELNDSDTGASDAVVDAPITIAPPATPEAEPAFAVDEVSVTPSGEPVQYADVAATVTNNGPDIPTANVTLIVTRDGQEVERYPLAEGKALPQGSTVISQRYIPAGGWQPGTWTFALEVSAVSDTTETVLATVEIQDEITVP